MQLIKGCPLAATSSDMKLHTALYSFGDERFSRDPHASQRSRLGDMEAQS